jgi:hypothetical protein
MRTLLRAKIWCDARMTLMSLISPVGESVNWIRASPFSMPCALRFARIGDVAHHRLEVRADDAGRDRAGGATGAGAAATTGGGAGAMTTGAGGGVGVVAVIVGAAAAGSRSGSRAAG